MANDALPVPAQLKAQLDKCKSVRDGDEYCKSRTKTAKENKESRSKLPPLPTK